jgi:hypothetical protein
MHKVHILYRVPQYTSPRRNWDSPTPSLSSECAPPPGTKGGDHLPAGEGLGESQFRRLEKKLSTLPTLCADVSVLYAGEGEGRLPNMTGGMFSFGSQ